MKRRTIVLAAAGAAAAAVAGRYGYSYYNSKKSSGPVGARRRPRMSASVQAVAVSLENVEVTLSALGTVTASKTADVVSQVQGRIQQIYFTEGQYVKKGTVLAKVDTSGYEANLQQYQGNLAENRARLANARTTLERYRKLLAEDSISRQDFEAQQAAVAEYEGAVKATEGQISSARVNVGYGTVVAPISGFAGLRGVDIGNLVGPSDTTPIVTITQTQPIAVTFSVPQVNLSDVVAPMRAGRPLTAQIFDQNGEKLLAKGTVTAVSNQIDASTGTVKLKTEIPNAENELFPNQFVSVKLVTRVLENVCVIPSSAVQSASDGTFVFTVDQDSVAHKTLVKTGPSADSSRITVLEGLKEGDRVVTTGVDSASDGGNVTIVNPAAAAENSAALSPAENASGAARSGRGKRDAEGGSPAAGSQPAGGSRPA